MEAACLAASMRLFCKILWPVRATDTHSLIVFACIPCAPVRALFSRVVEGETASYVVICVHGCVRLTHHAFANAKKKDKG